MKTKLAFIIEKDVESVIPAIPILSLRIKIQFNIAFKPIDDIAIIKGVFESLNA